MKITPLAILFPVATGLALALGGCSSEEDPAPSAGANDAANSAAAAVDDGAPSADALAGVEVVIPNPDKPIVDMGTVEDLSEEVANRFVDFADKLRRREFSALPEWVASDFVGEALSGLAVKETESLPLGSEKITYDVDAARVVDRDGFLASLRAILSEWEHVEAIVWKVKGAEFQTGFPSWGRVRFKVSMLGSAEGGAPRSETAWGWARVEKRRGNWLLTGFEVTSLDSLRRDAFLFTDVAASAGVAHTGIRFGQPGNTSFAWNGAAGGDVNGDGLWDIFVPNAERNFLYIGKSAAPASEGEPEVAYFEDQAEQWGVAFPGGGTGAVFFDYDNDGDQDLALADVGWDGGGNPLRLWRNDGDGKMTEVGQELGFGANTDGYSLVAFDAENDGFLDLFVCNYGRVDVDPNNSWIQATNGTPNHFYHNEGGKGFREVAVERGLVDTYWTYAAAAADYDRDGDTDLYVANDYGRNQLWVNDGTGHFTDAADKLGVQDLGNGMGCSWGDLNSDGELDLYVSDMSSTAGKRILKRLSNKDDPTWKELLKLASGNSIFLAKADDGGAEEFENCPPEMGGTGGSWAWNNSLVDLDLDGRLDIYCCSGFVTGDTPADT
ncbi:MAG TPA: VCBS repeat-containing protein [Planctomycetes bacterium]|nr:VCBS repeat-containing protein [Planctomycetota bacterium]